MTALNALHIQEAALAWLAPLGYSVVHAPDVAVGMPGAERSDPAYRNVVLSKRLRNALARLNPELPHEALDDTDPVMSREPRFLL